MAAVVYRGMSRSADEGIATMLSRWFRWIDSGKSRDNKEKALACEVLRQTFGVRASAVPEERAERRQEAGGYEAKLG